MPFIRSDIPWGILHRHSINNAEADSVLDGLFNQCTSNNSKDRCVCIRVLSTSVYVCLRIQCVIPSRRGSRLISETFFIVKTLEYAQGRGQGRLRTRLLVAISTWMFLLKFNFVPTSTTLSIFTLHYVVFECRPIVVC
jgi:hypothetical protein